MQRPSHTPYFSCRDPDNVVIEFSCVSSQQQGFVAEAENDTNGYSFAAFSQPSLGLFNWLIGHVVRMRQPPSGAGQHFDLAAMLSYDPFDQSQAEANSVSVRTVVQPLEWLEDTLAIGFWDALSVVIDIHRDEFAARTRR